MSNTVATYAHNSMAVGEPLPLTVDYANGDSSILFERIERDTRIISASVRLEAGMVWAMIRQCRTSATCDWLAPLKAVEPPCVEPVDVDLAQQQEKNQAAIRLLKAWLGDESGYDEQAWPRVKKAIEENRLSDRTRFDG